MKRNICIAICAFLLAAPATANALDWEIKEVTHTITAKAGENSIMVDGEEISLPEGTEVYKKDGYIMLPVEPLLDLLEKDAKFTWYREEGEPITAYAVGTILVFDTEKNEMYRNENKVELSGTLEFRGGKLFLPLRGWKAILEQCGHTVEGITWDSGTQTASLEYTGQELETEKPAEHTPAGEGAAPEYILKPTRKYERITNMGDGYFSAEIGSVSTKEDTLDSTGKVIQSYEAGIRGGYLGENRFLVRDYNYNKKEDREKVVDENGETVFSVEGSYIEPFSEGLAIIWTEDGKGFIDMNGEMAIPAKYSMAKPFSEGLAAVCLESRRGSQDSWGYIDKSGALAIDGGYERCNAFREGLAAVWVGGKWGYIDHDGREVIPPQYSFASDFYNGTAFVWEKDSEEPETIWVIDKTGKKLRLLAEGRQLNDVNSDYPSLYPGILKAEEIVEYTGGHSHLLTYYNADGEIPNEKLEWTFHSAEGLMAFQDKETGKYGYVDEGYNWVIAPVFDYAEDFQDGYAVVYQKTRQGDAVIDSEWGIIRRP